MSFDKHLSEKIVADYVAQYNRLSQYTIELGVVSVNSKREKVVIGLNNAELMFIHENGSPLRHLPSRPVLRMTIEYAKKEWLDKTIEKCCILYANNNFDDNVVEVELKKFCIKVEKYARNIIYSNDGRLAPNAPSTIARKGDNHPLFDTGQLAKSITCRLLKDGKEV